MKLQLEILGGVRWLRSDRALIQLRSFADCRDEFCGPVFLLASGPSAKEFRAKQYAPYPLMAMNGSILHCSEEGVEPFFYLCDDAGFARQRSDLALMGLHHAKRSAMSLEVMEALESARPGCLEGRSIYLLERVNRFVGSKRLSDKAYAWSIRRDPDLFSRFSLFRSKKNRIGFSVNMEKGYFTARTIPYVGMQLACHLGFKKIYLVGVDLTPALGRCYDEGGQALPTTLGQDYEDYILPSFQLAATWALPQRGVQLFGLSDISRLPATLVPRVSQHRVADDLTAVIDTGHCGQPVR